MITYCPVYNYEANTKSIEIAIRTKPRRISDLEKIIKKEFPKIDHAKISISLHETGYVGKPKSVRLHFLIEGPIHTD